jgi:hypothetical protein
VKKKDPALAIICTAKSKKIISSKSKKFRPHDPVNRAEALIMAFKTHPPVEGKAMILPYEDVRGEDWFFGAVLTAYSNGYLEEKGPLLYPGKSLTRGEAAELLYRMLVSEEQGKQRFEEETELVHNATDQNLQWQLFALDHLNQLRKDNGKAPLRLNSYLSEVAYAHSKDMGLNIGKWAHEGSLGEKAHERIKYGKIPDPENKVLLSITPPPDIELWYSAENVGMRNIKWTGSVEKAIISQNVWFMDEPVDVPNHRTTILSTLYPFTEVGLGLYLDDKGNLWITQDFISTPDE